MSICCQQSTNALLTAPNRTDLPFDERVSKLAVGRCIDTGLLQGPCSVAAKPSMGMAVNSRNALCDGSILNRP